jgi:hypothetical protein
VFVFFIDLYRPRLAEILSVSAPYQPPPWIKLRFMVISGACRLSKMETAGGDTAVAELLCGTAVAEMLNSSRCGSAVAELFDSDERENYTKIVLQKRMWIQVGEEEIIR